MPACSLECLRNGKCYSTYFLVYIPPFDTVDGKKTAPVDMVNAPLFAGFYTSQVVVWDFLHQQYFVVGNFKFNNFLVHVFDHQIPEVGTLPL